MDPDRKRDPVSWNSSRLSPTQGGKFRCPDGQSQGKAHKLEPLLPLTGGEDLGVQPGPPRLPLAPSGLLEPESKNEQPS
ncbi:unnamed protein product [Sphagnum jensenii]|uniref:Prolactin receptor n=1 Tax=Sphagnum jensenii TaxID=128206 RepID=A0ABP1A7W7_9BRYO